MISARAFALSSCLLLAILGCAEDEGPAPVPEGPLFAPEEDIAIAGSYEFDRVIIPLGVTVRATGPLSLHATRSIDVEGTIRGEGSSVNLISNGEVGIRGLISLAAGDSAEGVLRISARGPLVLAGAEIVAPAGVELSATGPEATIAIRASGIGREGVGSRRGAQTTNGASGGSVVIQSERSIVLQDAWLAAARGADAPPVTVVQDLRTEAIGAPGGRGANLALSAGDTLTFRGQVEVRPGSGGAGGDASATVRLSRPVESPPAALARGGRGGDAGTLSIRAGDWSTDDATVHLGSILGGRGGSAVAIGAAGWRSGGPCPSRGGDATAEGGRGGDVPDLDLVGVEGLRSTITIGSLMGGAGGTAESRGGAGPSGDERCSASGGRGGDMSSHGGDGGDVFARRSNGRALGTGGSAGDASFSGGRGGRGAGRCESATRRDRGGPGGSGGDASGGDGAPGHALRDGASGSVTLRSAGNGGEGGEGYASGPGGSAGHQFITVQGQLIIEEPSFQSGIVLAPCVDGRGACVTWEGGCVLSDSAMCAQEHFGIFFLGEECSPDVVERKGCCLPENRCVYATVDSCMGLGGFPLPEHTPCWAEACSARRGACCASDVIYSHCSITLEESCQDRGGVWLGDGVACGPYGRCPQELGACCEPLGTCVITTAERCTQTHGGTFRGAGIECEDVICPPPLGACCYFDGSCQPITRVDCRGIYQGDLTTCDPNGCGRDPSGEYAVEIAVLADPQGHEPRVRWTTIGAISITATGNTLRFEGASPWVALIGVVGIRGELTVAGSGVVGGVRGVDCRLEGTLDRRVEPPSLRGIITLGGVRPPHSLPGGPVTYSVSGQRVSGRAPAETGATGTGATDTRTIGTRTTGTGER